MTKNAEEGNRYTLISIPVVNIGEFSLCLPEPSVSNTGGYINFITKKHEYSPIDISVCCIEIKLRGFIFSPLSLSEWFKNSSNLISCTLLYLLIQDTDWNKYPIYSNSISHWKVLAQGNFELSHLLKRNAPFTFREL